METIKVNKISTKMIAHRGLSGFEKENTMAAFIAAGNHSYYGIECDIHPTIDNELVVIHDSDTARVSGVSKIVENSTYQELQQITLFTTDGGVKYPYQKIPTLREYLYCCKRYHKHCVIEFKEVFALEKIIQAINIVKEFDYLSETTFISFYPENLINVRSLDKNIDLQLLVGSYSDIVLEGCIKYNMELDINFKSLTKKIVEDFHKHNLVVNVWTVNNLDDANRMISMGVDYITTNILE